MEVKNQIHINICKKYIKEECNKDRTIKHHNLTKEEKEGLTGLKKIGKAGEIMIMEADKGKVFTVSSMQSYIKQGREHTSKDEKVKEGKAKIHQTKMTCTAKAICNIFCVESTMGTGIQKGALPIQAQTL